MQSGDVEDEGELNAKFDSIYNAGGIYHLFCHPAKVDWSPGKYAQLHLDHIKGKKDVWYVGFGHLYVYHYVQEQQKVTVRKLYREGT